LIGTTSSKERVVLGTRKLVTITSLNGSVCASTTETNTGNDGNDDTNKSGSSNGGSDDDSVQYGTRLAFEYA